MNKGKTKGRSNSTFALVVFMLIGIGLAIAGTVMTVNRKQKDSYYGTVTGKVTDVEYHTNSDGDDMYSVVYTYYVDDVAYTYADSTSSSSKPTLGKLVEIRYNPIHPNEAYVAGKMWPGIMLIGMGIIFVLASTLGFVNDGNKPQTKGRKLASGLLMGIIVSAMGWGILAVSGDSIKVVSFPGLVLSMFGVLGLFVIYRSVKDYITANSGSAPAGSRPAGYDANVQEKMVWDGNGAVRKEYTETMDYNQGQGTQNPYSGQVAQDSYGNANSDNNGQTQSAPYRDDTYQQSTYQGSSYQKGAYQDSSYQDNPVVDFYREHKQGIDTTIRTVQKGQNIVGSIIAIAVGVIFALTSLLMISGSVASINAMKAAEVGAVALPAYIMPIVMEGIFLIVGIYVVVKGIKGLLGK